MDNPVQGVKIVGRKSEWNDLPPEKSLFNQPPGTGIVIGNLTSQLLSNIFLNALDRFIVYRLGYKHYGRYVDDFYVVVAEEELPQIKRDTYVIKEFLASLGVKLHPKKQFLAEASQGVPFLGVYIHKGYVVPGTRLKRNFRQACYEVQIGKKDIDTLISYLGHIEHFNKFKFISGVFEKVAWEYNY